MCVGVGVCCERGRSWVSGCWFDRNRVEYSQYTFYRERKSGREGGRENGAGTFKNGYLTINNKTLSATGQAVELAHASEWALCFRKTGAHVRYDMLGHQTKSKLS